MRLSGNKYLQRFGKCFGNAEIDGFGEIFARKGFDLIVNLPIDYKTAVLGGKVRVPTLDETIEVDIPEGTAHGAQLLLRGKGIKTSNTSPTTQKSPSQIIRIFGKKEGQRYSLLNDTTFVLRYLPDLDVKTMGDLFEKVLRPWHENNDTENPNARIVAAGNDMKDSLAANQLAEPLFNRFAHVYIQTTVESWLQWASEHNIHPAIYAYIAYKKGESLRSKYDGEKPNADPRKWEMASKMLYATGQPEMLRALVGEDITREFCQFCNQRVITLEDVLNENYTEQIYKNV